MQITDNLLEQIIISLGSKFDSHDVIHKLGHENQRLYVNALAAIDNDRPFQILHSALGRRIKEICERLGYVGNNWRSQDIFGQNSECVQWSRP